ncbi:MAG: cytochrome c biogenesis protein CcdA [Rhodothermales bacterium]
MPTSRILFLLLFITCFASSTHAQQVGPPADYVSWRATVTKKQVNPGDEIDLKLEATISNGWKMYAMDAPFPIRGMTFAVPQLPEGIVQEGEVIQSTPPKEAFDKNFKMDVEYFTGSVLLDARYVVGADVVNGQNALSGDVGYQICSDELGLCLPPAKEKFSVSFAVTGGVDGDPLAAVLPADAGSPNLRFDSPVSSNVATSAPLSSIAGGLWGFILLAIGAGLGALLMPCVFPMIPLTVSYFTKHAADRSTAFKMASVYGLSIIVIFTGLGVLMAFLMGASGAQTIAANPWINLSIGLVFIVFALSLLGLFELRLPNGLLNYFNKQSNDKKGYTGVLFMGATLTLVSFSCTAPFVGTLLAATAGGEWVYPITGMLIFSATFALPFVLFALFPSGLSRLPASGSWMNTLKVVFGFIELAAAIKFLSNADLVWGWNLISRPIAISATTVILFMAGLYLIGKLRLKHEEPVEQIGTLRLITAIGFFGFSLYLLPGLFGAPLNNLDAFLPPRQGTDISLLGSMSRSNVAFESEEDWFEDIDEAFLAAKQEGKPVFIDFTGYTCTNCRQMESTVFIDPSISERFEQNFVLLKLYTDDLEKGPDLQRYQLNLTGTVALPTYAVVHPETEMLIARMSGTASVDEFSAFLDRGSSSFVKNLAFSN